MINEIPKEIRALSWKQPYASLMLYGKIETRTWNTRYRGKVLICASKQPYSIKDTRLISGHMVTENMIKHNVDANLYGKAIAIGDLVAVRPMQPKDEEKCMVKYNPYLWCHVYENVQPIIPFDWKGTQGWKTLSEEEISKIQILNSN
ncbi:hypothetical protein [Muricauda sp. MAR_2010_75]|uniref:hypothetical protein n=1 Tax=Allomuricauda sp. MAR_2010_75 TaxID=1250232 RepID=UPI0005674D76|nr:hypothetical protein [Muricauda sp. MAR_2010_75]